MDTQEQKKKEVAIRKNYSEEEYVQTKKKLKLLQDKAKSCLMEADKKY